VQAEATALACELPSSDRLPAEALPAGGAGRSKGKEMQDRLTKLVTIFNDLDFRRSRAKGDDLLGDAYEYLMRHFATESGKSKGQFYTPAEVSRVLAKVVGIGPGTRQDQTVYDPTCGSGSLLLKVAAEAPRGITIYGQEKDNAT
jgi:type I restriction enzyme M protein